MSIETIASKRRGLMRKIKKDELTQKDWYDIVKFYATVLDEIKDSVESIPVKDDNVLYIAAVERVKSILKAAEGIEVPQ